MRLLGLLIVVGLGLAGAAWLVFVPQRPAPSGPKGVAQTELLLRDAQGQPLPVTIWYPAATSTPDAPLDATKPAPVILYSPGLAGTRTQSSIQVKNLASHGFVVVACDDVSSDGSLNLESDTAMATTMTRVSQAVVDQAGRLLEVLRALAAGQPSLFADRLDLTKVGVLGYSIGGPAGLTASLRDPRIVAVFNLDGGLFGPPANEIGSAAYFLLSSRDAFPPESDLSSPNPSVRNSALVSAIDIPRNKSRMERPNNYWVQIPGVDHADLSDSLFVVTRAKIFRTNFERRATRTAIDVHQVAFFRSTLLGESAPLLELVGRNDRTVYWISSISTPSGTANARQ